MYIVDTRTYSSIFPLSSNFEQMVPQSGRCGVENREVPLQLELGHRGCWRAAASWPGRGARAALSRGTSLGDAWGMGGWLGDNWGMGVMVLGTFFGLGQVSRSWAWTRAQTYPDGVSHPGGWGREGMSRGRSPQSLSAFPEVGLRRRLLQQHRGGAVGVQGDGHFGEETPGRYPVLAAGPEQSRRGLVNSGLGQRGPAGWRSHGLACTGARTPSHVPPSPSKQQAGPREGHSKTGTEVPLAPVVPTFQQAWLGAADEALGAAGRSAAPSKGPARLRCRDGTGGVCPPVNATPGMSAQRWVIIQQILSLHFPFEFACVFILKVNFLQTTELAGSCLDNLRVSTPTGVLRSPTGVGSRRG